jgi:hypothetical protein
LLTKGQGRRHATTARRCKWFVDARANADKFTVEREEDLTRAAAEPTPDDVASGSKLRACELKTENGCARELASSQTGNRQCE